MQADFPSCSPKLLNLARDVSGLITSGAHGRLVPGDITPGSILVWHHEKGRTAVSLEFQIVIELMPKIAFQPDVNERQGQRRHPVHPDLAHRQPTAPCTDERSQRCAKEESEHGMIAFVIANTDAIHIVRQAGNKAASGGHGRNFHQSDRVVHDRLPQEGNMQFQGGNGGMNRWLANRQQMSNFLKEIVADAQDATSHRIEG